MKNFSKYQKPKARSPQKESNQFQVDENKLKKVLAGDVKEMNSYADELAKRFYNEKLSTSQIRNILDEVQRMPERDFDENRLHLLRPKLAYAAGRHEKIQGVLGFQKLIDKAIQMTGKENYKNFRNFVEAIVAYHRYHGGD